MRKVAVVDDQVLFRQSFVSILNSMEGIEVVFDARNGKEFFEMLSQSKIDVALVDIRLPCMNGYEICEHIRKKHPAIKVIIISTFADSASVEKVLNCKAHGYYTKDTDISLIAVAIRTVKEADFLFASELQPLLKEAFANKNGERINSPKQAFSPREIEIISMICKEYNSQHIAEKLFLSVRTIETHRAHIMKKIGARNIAGVVKYAIDHGYFNDKD